MIDDIPYYTFMIWDESHKEHSYGTLSFYYLIQHLYGCGYEYLYTSEYYSQFNYKSKLPNFEWWNGTNWVKENKTQIQRIRYECKIN